MDVFSKLGLNQVIDSSLGQRGSTGTAFQYSDIISSLFYSYLCGADCLEDINTLVAQFSLSPKCTLPGADTVGRGLKELKEANVVYTCDKSKHAYKFNKAEKLNQPFEQWYFVGAWFFRFAQQLVSRSSPQILVY